MSKESYKLIIDLGKDTIRIKHGQPLSGYVDLEFSRLMLGLEEIGYKLKVPSLLYRQVTDYLAGTWSKDCFKEDTGTELSATNGRIRIDLDIQPGSTPFLEVYLGQGNAERPLFDGYIRNIEDFKLIMELTSVQGLK